MQKTARSCIAIRKRFFWNFAPCSLAYEVFWGTYGPQILPTMAFSVFPNILLLITFKIDAITFKAQMSSLNELSINTFNN